VADEKEKRDLGQEILDRLIAYNEYKEGKRQLRTRRLEAPSPPAEIRAKLKLSQMAFAGLMGVSVRTVQDWEQGRRKPTGPARQFLRVAEQHPEALLDLR
jgi:putative transcriptional regulator